MMSTASSGTRDQRCLIASRLEIGVVGSVMSLQVLGAAPSSGLHHFLSSYRAGYRQRNGPGSSAMCCVLPGSAAERCDVLGLDQARKVRHNLWQPHLICTLWRMTKFRPQRLDVLGTLERT